MRTVEERRAAIEQIIQASARWGWTMAKLGMREPPVPVIEWDDKGRPYISVDWP